MAGHTPGPWQVAPCDWGTAPGRTPRGDFVVWSTEGFTVCRVRAEAYPTARDAAREDGANAKLIAAAPQLLEACKAAYEVMTQSERPIFNILQAAIDKATK